METSTKRVRAADDRGAVLILMAVGLAGLIAIGGLALDGGLAYGERRQMQNAADAASMAATRELDRYITGKSSNAGLILAAAQDTAEHNGADRDEVSCTLVTFDRSTIEPCPTGSALSAVAAASATGVKVSTEQTKRTFFMQIVGHKSFTAAADATAQIGRPGGSFVAPFVFCATAPGHDPQVLVPDTESDTLFSVNEASIGVEYTVHGNAIKDDGRDCQNPSSSFRGLVNTGSDYTIPGDWDTETGDHTGPTRRLVNSGSACTGSSFTNGCLMVLPLCTRGNGQGGTGYRAYCVDLGLFEVSYVGNHDTRAIFRGAATINRGGIVGPADRNGARIVAITD